MTDAPVSSNVKAADAAKATSDVLDPGKSTVIGIYFDPPMAIARVGSSHLPMDAYEWAIDENPHKGVQTKIVPATSLIPRSLSGDGHWPHYLKAETPDRITFKDEHGRIRPVAPFFELWARVQLADGKVVKVPVTRDFLEARKAALKDIIFTVDAGNRKAQSRTKLASCAAVAHVIFAADNYRPHRLDAISPRTKGQVPMVTPEAPPAIGHSPDLRAEPGGVFARLQARSGASSLYARFGRQFRPAGCRDRHRLAAAAGGV
jgi:hypothetical protein